MAGGGCRLEIWGAAIPHGVQRAGSSSHPRGTEAKRQIQALHRARELFSLVCFSLHEKTGVFECDSGVVTSDITMVLLLVCSAGEGSHLCWVVVKNMLLSHHKNTVKVIKKPGLKKELILKFFVGLGVCWVWVFFCINVIIRFYHPQNLLTYKAGTE